MAHPRQQIREAVKALLVGKTAAGSRVYETQYVPFRSVQLPAIALYMLSESIDPDGRNSAPRELRRTARLEVVGVVEKTNQQDNLDDLMDDLALEIETAMNLDPSVGLQDVDTFLSSVELDLVSEGNEKPRGRVGLVYQVLYIADALPAPDARPGLLATADIKTSLGGAVHPDNQAEDRQPVPTT